MYFTWEKRNAKTNELEIVELCENGAETPITDQNKEEYINKVVNFITFKSLKEKIDPFFEGFRSLIPNEVLQIFNIQELEFLISGQSTIDVSDWQQNTIYKGTFNEDHTVINLLIFLRQ